MSQDEARKTIEPIVRKWLSTQGLRTVDVRFAPDHDGEPSIFIEAKFGERQQEIDPEALSNAISELRDVLTAKGEERFPYLKSSIPAAADDR